MTDPHVRKPLPDTRQSRTHKVKIESSHGIYTVFITVGLWEDGSPGELFLNIGKQGSTIRGFADAYARQLSLSLQYGQPLKSIIEKTKDTTFEPAGTTSNPDIPHCSSIPDYVVRWMEVEFGPDR